MHASLPSLSREYVKNRIRWKEGGEEVDPTSYTVEYAFTSSATTEPGDSDWVAGSWETVNGRYYSRVLVGPGGTTTLADGTWHVWVRITAATERPVRLTGRIIVT